MSTDHELDRDVSELATDADGLITAIASFFDVAFVSPRKERSVLGARARDRSKVRLATPLPAIRR